MSAHTKSPKEIRLWREEFVAWLRIGNVPGDEVGDALKTVESHCADTGEAPQDAFGDPRAYAESLGLARPGKRSTYLIAVPAFFGATFLVNGITHLVGGGAVSYRWTDLAGWAVMLAAAVCLIATIGRIRRPVLFSVSMLATAFAAVILLTFLGQGIPPLIEANAWVVTVAGGLMSGSAILAARPTAASLVTDPVSGKDMLAGSPMMKWSPVAVPIIAMIAVVVLSLVT